MMLGSARKRSIIFRTISRAAGFAEILAGAAVKRPSAHNQRRSRSGVRHLERRGTDPSARERQRHDVIGASLPPVPAENLIRKRIGTFFEDLQNPRQPSGDEATGVHWLNCQRRRAIETGFPSVHGNWDLCRPGGATNRKRWSVRSGRKALVAMMQPADLLPSHPDASITRQGFSAPEAHPAAAERPNHRPPDRDELVAELAYLAFRLANLSTYFRRELLNEPVPYSADGISFPALVQLVRIEENLFGWGWLPEHDRALGLAINPGDELVGASGPDSYTIKDRRGNCREFYRYH